MDTPTTPGDPVVLPNAHSALINNKLDEFLNSFARFNNTTISLLSSNTQLEKVKQFA